jgi:hypothetical protein
MVLLLVVAVVILCLLALAAFGTPVLLVLIVRLLLLFSGSRGAILLLLFINLLDVPVRPIHHQRGLDDDARFLLAFAARREHFRRGTELSSEEEREREKGRENKTGISEVGLPPKALAALTG